MQKVCNAKTNAAQDENDDNGDVTEGCCLFCAVLWTRVTEMKMKTPKLCNETARC